MPTLRASWRYTGLSVTRLTILIAASISTIVLAIVALAGYAPQPAAAFAAAAALFCTGATLGTVIGGVTRALRAHRNGCW